MSELIFVTGGAGFLASHIVVQLLEAGYRVRATARGHKVAEFKRRLARFGDQLEVVDVPDVATGVFPLDGVNAVIHTASPLPGKGTAEQMMNGAIEGSVNILRQAQAAGIKRFVFTSSIVAAWSKDSSFKDTDWTDIPIEAAKGSDLSTTYIVSKTYAEKAVWDFGAKHPKLDITTINPPFLYGPISEGLPIPDAPSWGTLSTDTHIFRLIDKYNPSFPRLSGYIDVRDAARAHVLALEGKNPDPARKKRFPISSPHPLNFDAVLALIAEKRPELKDRLLSGPAPKYTKEQSVGLTDLKRLEEVIGFKREEYHSLEETILDAVDSLLELEKNWVAHGHEVRVPA